MIDDDRKSLRTALQAAITALNDWLHLTAPEQCGEEHVRESEERVFEYGTIAYIADVTTQCRNALKLDKENDQNSN
jgi:hypothetical protein